MKIIRYGNREDIDIEFLDDFHYVKKNQVYANFKTGSVKNPYDKSLFNIGFLGDGEYVSRKNDKLEDAVNKMESIIVSERCRVDRIEETNVSNIEEVLHEGVINFNEDL